MRGLGCGRACLFLAPSQRSCTLCFGLATAALWRCGHCWGSLRSLSQQAWPHVEAHALIPRLPTTTLGQSVRAVAGASRPRLRVIVARTISHKFCRLIRPDSPVAVPKSQMRTSFAATSTASPLRLVTGHPARHSCRHLIGIGAVGMLRYINRTLPPPRRWSGVVGRSSGFKAGDASDAEV